MGQIAPGARGIQSPPADPIQAGQGENRQKQEEGLLRGLSKSLDRKEIKQPRGGKHKKQKQDGQPVSNFMPAIMDDRKNERERYEQYGQVFHFCSKAKQRCCREREAGGPVKTAVV